MGRALLAAWATLLAAGAFGFDVPAKPAARVNDYAGVLSADAERTIGERLAAFEQETSNQIVVATIPSLDGGAIEDLSVRTFEKWGLGQKGKNNGVLLLVAVADHRARIEVGYGLEDRLTDALSRRILEAELFPALRKDDWDGGVRATVEAIVQATTGTYVAPKPPKRKAPWFVPLVPIGILLLFFLISSQSGRGISGRGGRRVLRTGPFWWGGLGGGGGFGGGGWGGGGGGWGGGGGGGGFSGGGGMSGGGGASGSW